MERQRTFYLPFIPSLQRRGDKRSPPHFRNFAISHFAILLSLLFTLHSSLFSQSGDIQLAIPSPDPVRAGELVTFQVILVNTGVEPWRKGDYFAEVELYDASRKYIMKSERVKGEVDVESSGSTLLYVPMKVQEAFTGEYLYRVNLQFKEQRLVQAPYQTLTITPLVITVKPPPKIQVGGNTILSYKRTKKAPGASEYFGSFNLNMVGKAYNTPISLNAYVVSKSAQRFDLDNILFSFYDRRLTMHLGDVQPGFTTLALSGAGMRGAFITMPIEKFSAGAVFAQSARSSEGTSTTNGTFRRFLYGAQSKYDLPWYKGSLEATLAGSFDDAASVKTTGPTLKPVKNQVAAGGTKWEFGGWVGVGAEYAIATFSSDAKDASTRLFDRAYKGTLSFIKVPKLTLTGGYSVVKPNFTSLGSPIYTKDKKTLEGTLRYAFSGIGSLGGSYNTFSDNLLKDPTKVTTKQTLISISGSLQRAGLPTLNLGYSMNKSKGSFADKLNNQTNTMSAGMGYGIARGRVTVNLGGQMSQFKDLTGVAADLGTTSGNLNLFTRIGNRASFTLGGTFSNVKNKKTNFADKTTSLSVNTNFKILPNRLGMALWGSLTQRKNPSPTVGADTKNTSLNAEITYDVLRYLSITLGATQNNLKDKLKPANDNKDTSASLRTNLSF